MGRSRSRAPLSQGTHVLSVLNYRPLDLSVRPSQSGIDQSSIIPLPVLLQLFTNMSTKSCQTYNSAGAITSAVV